MRVQPILLLLFASAASAQSPVETAREQYEAGRLDVAQELFQTALRSGGLSPDELVVVEWHLGVLATAADETQRAADSFERVLAMDPQFRAGLELAPGSIAVFEGIRRGRAGRSVSLSFQESAQTVRVTVDNAPARWVSQLRVRINGDVHTVRGETLEVPVPERTMVQGVALDAFGNTIVSASRMVGAEPHTEEQRLSRIGRWLVSVAGVVFVGAAALTLGLLLRPEQNVVLLPPEA